MIKASLSELYCALSFLAEEEERLSCLQFRLLSITADLDETSRHYLDILSIQKTVAERRDDILSEAEDIPASILKLAPASFKEVAILLAVALGSLEGTSFSKRRRLLVREALSTAGEFLTSASDLERHFIDINCVDRVVTGIYEIRIWVCDPEKDEDNIESLRELIDDLHRSLKEIEQPPDSIWRWLETC